MLTVIRLSLTATAGGCLLCLAQGQPAAVLGCAGLVCLWWVALHRTYQKLLWDNTAVGDRISQLGGVYVDRSLDAPPRSLTYLYNLLFSPGPQIVHVDLGNTPVANEDVEFLAELPQLRSLDLSSTGITEAVFRELPALSELQILRLSNVAASDEVCYWIAQCTSLRFVDLRGTSVTDEGVTLMQEALPQLRGCELAGTLVSPTLCRRLSATKRAEARLRTPLVAADSEVAQ